MNRERETTEERKARRARNRQELPSVINLLSDDDMGQPPMGPAQGQATPGNPEQQPGIPGLFQTQEQAQGAAQGNIVPGSVEAAQQQAVMAAQALAAGRTIP